MISEDKQNINPNVYSSPLQSKLDEISFFSSDFQEEASAKVFNRLRGNLAEMLTPSKPRAQKKQAKTRNTPKNKKTIRPYDSVRVARPGITMFDMVKATDTPEKVVTFLQEHGCLATHRLCPDCNNVMLLVDRKDKIQSKVFRCRKKNGDKKCQKTISITADSFFFNIHMSLFTVLWLLWGFSRANE